MIPGWVGHAGPSLLRRKDTNRRDGGCYSSRKCRIAGLAVVALAAAAGATVLPAAAAPAVSSFAWVHVTANSGGSSGGHAAVCFADRCFHFQQVDDARIRLRRDPLEKFDFDYRVLGNRSLDIRHVAVPPATRSRIEDAFARRLAAEHLAFAALDERRADRLFLERLAGDRSEPVVLPHAGYFVADTDGHGEPWFAAPGEPATPLVALRQRIAARFGDGFLDRRATELRAAIAALAPEPGTEAGFAARHRELLDALVAIEILRAAPPLRPGSLVAAGPLSADETAGLQAFAARLQTALVDLLDSPRPDRGRPLLVGLARLLAVDASLASGTLLVLDVLERDPPVVPAAEVARQRPVLAQIAAERRADLTRLRAAFFTDPAGSEARWSLLEVAATLVVEMEQGIAEGRSIRLHRGEPLPRRGARRADWPLPALDGGALARALAAAREREAAAAAALDARYAYDLFDRNCVTELFATIDTALAGEDAGGVAQALGGRIDGQAGWNFVPAVAARAVEANWSVVGREERPSWRQTAVRRMRAAEPAWRVALREGNALTATAYRTNSDDPAFLLFSDDAGLARPLFGVVNVGWGAATSVVGAALAPFDGAARLRAGVEGMLYGVPELAFAGIRKGTYAFAPRSWAAEP